MACQNFEIILAIFACLFTPKRNALLNQMIIYQCITFTNLSMYVICYLQIQFYVLKPLYGSYSWYVLQWVVLHSQLEMWTRGLKVAVEVK